MGNRRKSAYANRAGEAVSWEFLGLHQLSELLSDELSDGTEVYSWLARDLPAMAVRPKAALDVYSASRNKDRKAEDLLEEQ